MARDFVINGESMLYVKGAQGSEIADVTELGLSDRPIQVTVDNKYLDLIVDTNAEVAVDVQSRLSTVSIQVTLVHYDEAVLDEVLRLNMGNAPIIGTMSNAWVRLGGGLPLYSAGTGFVMVGVSSPAENKPYTFYACYLFGPPFVLPLGTERSLTTINFRAIPYMVDPWNAGFGALGTVVWNNTLMGA